MCGNISLTISQLHITGGVKMSKIWDLYKMRLMQDRQQRLSAKQEQQKQKAKTILKI